MGTDHSIPELFSRHDGLPKFAAPRSAEGIVKLTTGAADEEVQVVCADSTIPLCSRSCPQSLQSGEAQTEIGSPPNVESAFFRDLGSGHGSLTNLRPSGTSSSFGP